MKVEIAEISGYKTPGTVVGKCYWAMVTCGLASIAHLRAKMRLSVWLASLWAVRSLCQPPNPKPDYTFEHPYTRPAKPNGLAIEKPNMILFMPDQLRYDAVGVFGNKVRENRDSPLRCED